VKILQLCTKVPFPPRDGGAAGIFTFSESLSLQGNTIYILAVNPPKHFISDANIDTHNANIRIISVSVNTNPRIKAALKNLLFSNMPYQVERFIDNTYKERLTELLITFEPDIVQLEGIYLAPYISVIKKISKAKVVLRSHNIEHVLWKSITKQEKNWVKKGYLHLQANRLKKYEITHLGKVDGITVLSNQDASLLKDISNSLHIKTIPFGLSVSNNNITLIDPVNAISYMGALDWIPNQKGLTWFIQKIWPEIRGYNENCIFHIAGRNAPLHISNDLKNTKGINFLGEIEETEPFYTLTNIIVVPLFAGSGIRIKILEAMQKGKIVIASSKAIEGINATPGVHFLLANSREDFIENINFALKHQSQMQNISDNAQSFIKENFNIHSITKHLVNFYSEL
jgi:glycosyltransferase involved in cell wall biosynthesis